MQKPQLFANYQVSVAINHQLPRNCCEVTVQLADGLAEVIGWKRRVFVCKKKASAVQRSMTPIHATDQHLSIIARDHGDEIHHTLELNSLQVRLFPVK